MVALCESFLHCLGSWQGCDSPGIINIIDFLQQKNISSEKVARGLIMKRESNNCTRVGEEVVAVGPKQRLGIPGAQSVCRESLQTMHLVPQCL